MTAQIKQAVSGTESTFMQMRTLLYPYFHPILAKHRDQYIILKRHDGMLCFIMSFKNYVSIDVKRALFPRDVRCQEQIAMSGLCKPL